MEEHGTNRGLYLVPSPDRPIPPAGAARTPRRRKATAEQRRYLDFLWTAFRQQADAEEVADLIQVLRFWKADVAVLLPEDRRDCDSLADAFRRQYVA